MTLKVFINSNNELSYHFRNEKELTVADLTLLCDLFYLPFEHGGSGIHLLQEFHWLKTNAHVLASSGKQYGDKEVTSSKPEVMSN